MPPKHQQVLLATLLALLSLTTACKKDISLPDPALEPLFGTWTWVQSTGGFGGDKVTPATAGYSQTVEFNKNGIYKRYKDGNQEEKMKFSLTIGSSVLSSGTAYLITYKKTGMFHGDGETQSIRFGGQDTLFLREECYDCYEHTYIRQ